MNKFTMSIAIAGFTALMYLLMSGTVQPVLDLLDFLR